MENEINEFLKGHEFDPESFEIFEIGEGMMFAKVLYVDFRK